MAVLTYKHAYLYNRLSKESWKTALNRLPMMVYLPAQEKTKLRQREALCFGPQGRSLFVTSEDRHAPLYRLERLSY
jgi:Mlc titration factor MtfA (ptsG expression regulator)